MKTENCIIILNGRIPNQLLNRLKKADGYYVICADGASNALYKYKIKPDCIIGDFDSIKTSVVTYYRIKRVKVIQLKEQEHTDFEKCMMYARDKGFKKAIIIGMTGKRADHNLNNLSVLLRYSEVMSIKAIDKTFEIYYADKETSFEYKKDELVSLIPMHSAKGITTEGLLYPLNNEDLIFGKREGALNRSNNEKVSVKMNEGKLLVFRKHFNHFKKLFPPVD